MTYVNYKVKKGSGPELGMINSVPDPFFIEHGKIFVHELFNFSEGQVATCPYTLHS